MYKTEFKLKQQTPIIHFQPKQLGATLRASEIKPKLDKHLLSILFNNEFENAKSFLSGYSKEHENILKKKFEKGFTAFDYKISIITNPASIIITSIPDRFPCFFGNMGEENSKNPKMFSYTDNLIRVIFKTDHKRLCDSLEGEVPNFFARNNFGNRQSKGFGSFYIDKSDSKYELPGLYSYFQTSGDLNGFKTVFEDIEMVHKVFRSGINDIGRNQVNLFYMKPLIWQYFREKGISWEKRMIKRQFYNSDLKIQMSSKENEIEQNESGEWPIYFEGKKYNIIKDMLGLSSLENWRVPYKNTIIKKSETIDRMKSPFFYKPIMIGNEFRIYVDFDSFPRDFLNTEFTISNGVSEFRLNTADEFDLDNFFDWCLNDVNIENLIDKRYLKTSKAKRILKIFSQLNQHLNY